MAIVGKYALSGTQDYFECGRESISTATAEDETSSVQTVAVQRNVSATPRD